MCKIVRNKQQDLQDEFEMGFDQNFSMTHAPVCLQSLDPYQPQQPKFHPVYGLASFAARARIIGKSEYLDWGAGSD